LNTLDLQCLLKFLPSREEPDISSSNVNSKAQLHFIYTCALWAYFLLPEHSSTLKARSYK